MLIREQKGYPRYLLPNQYNKEYMYPDSRTYFYTDITENDYGDLIINFKQGGGQICARIVEKDKVDNNSNWLHRVNLDLTCTEKFNQDTYRQIISIGKDNTGKCTKGCEIYIDKVIPDRAGLAGGSADAGTPCKVRAFGGGRRSLSV